LEAERPADERSVAICLWRGGSHASGQSDTVSSIGLIGGARSEPTYQCDRQKAILCGFCLLSFVN